MVGNGRIRYSGDMGDSSSQVGALDGVLIAGALFASAAVAAFPFFVVPTFVAMYQDFGSQLPILTRVVIGSAYSLGTIGVVVLACVVGVVLVLAGQRGPGRISLLVATGVGMLMCAFTMMGLYLPILQVAGAVR